MIRTYVDSAVTYAGCAWMVAAPPSNLELPEKEKQKLQNNHRLFTRQ